MREIFLLLLNAPPLVLSVYVCVFLWQKKYGMIILFPKTAATKTSPPALSPPWASSHAGTETDV